MAGRVLANFACFGAYVPNGLFIERGLGKAGNHGLATRLASIAIKTRHVRKIVANSSDDGESENSGSEGKQPSTDWDTAWSKFKNTVEENKGASQPKTGPRASGSGSYNPPQFQSQRSMNKKKDDIRDIEGRALDVWTDPKFPLIGGAVIFAILIYALVIVGPPPSR
eukprot:jgi/Mesvir1/28175/Mv04735-RA.1